MRNVTIVGAGRLGRALSLALDRAGYATESLVFRTEPPATNLNLYRHKPNIIRIGELESIASDIIFITTQDSEIVLASRQLADLVTGSPTVFITSGALSSDSISNLGDIGCKIGSFHPLVSVSDPVIGAERFAGAFFCLEGDLEAIDSAKSIVHSLGGRSFSVPADKKPLYHAAAVTSSGHFVALVDIAIGLLEKCGLPRAEAKDVLLPLIASTLENMKIQDSEESLTGTFARGDTGTFDLHLASLRANADADEIETFLALGARSIAIAKRARGNNGPLDRLLERVLMAKRELR